jgi:hypothetical protein
MIKKALLVFIILSISYATFMNLKPTLGAAQNQYQGNIIKAQNYLYNDSDTLDAVIVGSSLAFRLVMDSLPRFYNLSVAGMSIFDGLNIVKNKAKLPKTVYIETNIFSRPENKTFTKTLFSSLYYSLGKYFVFLRADKQPLAISSDYMNVLKSKIITKTRGYFQKNKNKNNALGKNIKNIQSFTNALNLQIDTYSKPLDSIFLSKQMSHLAEYIHFLNSKGVNTCFFEMPINPKLLELPRATQVRNQLHKTFPMDSFNYILPDTSLYETTDGEHLDNFEALKYTSFFKKSIHSN